MNTKPEVEELKVWYLQQPESIRQDIDTGAELLSEDEICEAMQKAENENNRDAFFKAFLSLMRKIDREKKGRT